MSIRKNSFWNGFFFVLGFTTNPFLKKAREIKGKTVNDRISDNFEKPSNIMNDVYLREMAYLNE